MEKRFLNILQKAQEEGPITVAEANFLGTIPCTEDHLSLMKEASMKIRQRAFGREMTFSQNIFIPLTNICRDYCSYCTFRKDPDNPGAKIMTPKEVLEVVVAGKNLGCKEVLISLGDKADHFPRIRNWLNERGYRNMLEYTEVICDLILQKTGLLPHVNAGVVSNYYLNRLKRVTASQGLMLENSSQRLLEKGEVHEKAPDKDPKYRLAMIEQAGKLKIPFTTGILIGIGETWEERVHSLFAIWELHKKYGHIQEVIIQNFQPKQGTTMANVSPPSLEEIIKTICVANLIFQGQIHLQAPPNLNASYLNELIQAGIDDWGGISPVTTDFINPEAPWPNREALLTITKEAGLIPKERLPIYQEFNKEPFIHHEMKRYLSDQCLEVCNEPIPY